MKYLLLPFIFCVLICVSSEKARYDKYRVYKIIIDDRKQLETLKLLADTSDSYNFWQSPMNVGSHVEVVVPPHKFADFADITEAFKLRTELLINDLQEIFDKENHDPKRRKDANEMNWIEYHSVETIHNWLDSIKAEFPSYVNVTTIGNSYEGRSLKLLKLSKKEGNRAIFVEAHIHAREWIASATATWIINELLRTTNPLVKELADNIDWYFLPIANPDGYEYTRNSNRNWRKTRSKQSILCWGVDPNRNFGYNWMVPDEVGSTGSSTSPCSDVFSGPEPFSEPECFAIDRFLNGHRGIFDAYLALHSYDHSILFPYGNSKARVPNFEELQQVGQEAATMLKSKHGTTYRVGNQAEILYSASGNSQDHAYGQYGINISFTYEMRGNGDYGNFGFFLPPEYIIPNAEEVMESFIGLVRKARFFGKFQ